jgi:hypothetical protein
MYLNDNSMYSFYLCNCQLKSSLLRFYPKKNFFEKPTNEKTSSIVYWAYFNMNSSLDYQLTAHIKKICFKFKHTSSLQSLSLSFL